MKVLVIIPAYNEEENILRVVRQLEAANTGCDYVVINDCSKDSTPKILDENKAERHIRGGLATKAKYEKNHYLTIDNDKLIV